jgi:hypothetical protein
MLKNKTSPRGRLIVLRMPVVILPSGGNYGGALSACTTSAKWRSEAETLPLCHRAVNGPASCSSPSIDLGTIAEPTFGVRDEQLSRLATSLSAEVEVGMYITHVLSPCVLSFSRALSHSWVHKRGLTSHSGQQGSNLVRLLYRSPLHIHAPNLLTLVSYCTFQSFHLHVPRSPAIAFSTTL